MHIGTFGINATRNLGNEAWISNACHIGLKAVIAQTHHQTKTGLQYIQLAIMRGFLKFGEKETMVLNMMRRQVTGGRTNGRTDEKYNRSPYRR